MYFFKDKFNTQVKVINNAHIEMGHCEEEPTERAESRKRCTSGSEIIRHSL